jgi:integrase
MRKSQSGRRSFGTYLTAEYLPGRVAAGRAPKTIQTYTDDINNHIIPALGNRSLSGIDTESLQRFVNQLRIRKQLDPKTIKNVFGVVSAALNQAAKIGRIPANPAKLVELPRRSNTEQLARDERSDAMAWCREEISSFFRAAPPGSEMTRWAVVGASTGMRPGEQCARKWTDWHGDRLRISSALAQSGRTARKEDRSIPRWQLAVTKNRSRRRIKVSDECIQALREQRAHVEHLRATGEISAEQAKYMFPSYSGSEPFSNPAKIYNRWRYFITGHKSARLYVRSTPLPEVRFIPLYGLRHTHATDLLRNGLNVKFVAKRLGTSVKMVEDHYGHVLEDMEDQAIGDLPPLGFVNVQATG